MKKLIDINEIKNDLVELNNFMKENKIEGSSGCDVDISHSVRCGASKISLNNFEQRIEYFISIQKGKKSITSQYSICENTLPLLKSEVLKLNEQVNLMPEVEYLKPITKIVSGKNFQSDCVDESFYNFDSVQMVNLYKKVKETFKNDNIDVSGLFTAGVNGYALINTLVNEPAFYFGGDYRVEVVLQLLNHNKREIKATQCGEFWKNYNEKMIIDELKTYHILNTSIPFSDDTINQKTDVVFSANAYAELMQYMSYVTLCGEAYEFQSGMIDKTKVKIGDKIFGDNITITDSLNSKTTLFVKNVGQNGTERKEQTVIEKGKLNYLYYSSKTVADRFKKEVNNSFQDCSLVLSTGIGPSTLEEVIEATKNTNSPILYIKDLHYMNFTNIGKGEFTCTSRFGTFMVKNGKVESVLNNVRINDSYFNMFTNVEYLSKNAIDINTGSTYGLRKSSAMKIPAFVKVKGVNITA